MKVILPKISKYRPPVLCLFASLILLISLLNYLSYLKDKAPSSNVLGTEIEADNSTQDIDFWEHLLEINPKYFPGLVELAKLQFKTDNVDSYIETLNKIKSLNPNSSIIQSLESK